MYILQKHKQVSAFFEQDINDPLGTVDRIPLSEAWKKAMAGASQADLHERLTRDLPGNLNIEVEFNRKSKKISKLLMDDNHKDIMFYYMFGSDGAYFHLGEVKPEYRGRGYARSAQRNIFEFLQENNVSSVSADANRMGVYAWPRMGFVPTQKAWDTEIKPKISKRLEAIQCIARNVISSEDLDYIDEIKEHLESDDPKTLWDIVDKDRQFLEHNKLSWGKALLFPIKELPEDLHVNESKYDITFTCHLNFNDPESYDRAMSYLYSANGDAVPEINRKENGETAFNIAPPEIFNKSYSGAKIAAVL